MLLVDSADSSGMAPPLPALSSSALTSGNRVASVLGIGSVAPQLMPSDYNAFA